MKNEEILNGLEMIVRAVRLALKTDEETALALLELNGYLMHCSAQNRAVLDTVLTDHGFRRLLAPLDWETSRKFCVQHKSGVFVLEYPYKLLVIVDGTLETGEETADKPSRVWYKAPCGSD